MNGTKKSEDPYEQLQENRLRKHKTRKTIRGMDTPFPLVGYGKFHNMSKKVKIPAQRNTYLREAFFKLYFNDLASKKIDPVEALRIFATLFFYHQEIRIETRLLFNRCNKENLQEDKYSALMEYLNRLVIDGCNSISTTPKPRDYAMDIIEKYKRGEYKNKKEYSSAISTVLHRKELVDITFNPKKRDFPRTDELFLKLAGKDAGPIEEDKKSRRFISILKLDHSIKHYVSISRLIWTQAVALLVRDALEELEQEINTTGTLYAYIPQVSINSAIDHFNQNYPRAKEMDINEKAYSISLRYKNKTSDKPYNKKSILKALHRKKKTA